MRTGTPPRLDGRTIDFSELVVQESENPPTPFSYMTEQVAQIDHLVPCHMTHTSEAFHEIVRDTLPYNCHIQEEVTGPRYCPSIESKIIRFTDKKSHQIWLEPEGLNTHVVYPNGISTTMPEEAQEEAIRTIKGLEHVDIIAHGIRITSLLRCLCVHIVCIACVSWSARFTTSLV
eukprot:m.72072 g.72072  ORF g.72072 m.72072 type:complete len:175 (+) comp12325_c0_seq2:996-1520(+)